MTLYSELTAGMHNIMGLCALHVFIIAVFIFVISCCIHLNRRYIILSALILTVAAFIQQGFNDHCLHNRYDEIYTVFYAAIGNMPWVLAAGVMFVTALCEVILSVHISWKRKQQLTPGAIKESLDDLQNGATAEGTEIIQNYPSMIVRTKDGTVWDIRKKEIAAGKPRIWELAAYDITVQHNLNSTLENRIRRLNQINARLKDYNRNVDSIIREREILSAKVSVHDDVGRTLLAARSYMEQPKHERNREKLLSLWRYNLAVMRNDIEPQQQSNEWKLLLDAAEAVDVEIVLNGELPEERTVRKAIVSAVHECLTNTVKHAGGNRLEVNITGEDLVSVSITNDGTAPSGEIQETDTYVLKENIDLVIMDILMNDGSNGLSSAERIKKNSPDTRIIAVTSMPEPSWLGRARSIGVDSFRYKEASKETIINVMDRTMMGESVYPDSAPETNIGIAVKID